MTLIEEVDLYFGTKNLYEVINVDCSATEAQIKKAYRKASLKIHPDRVDEAGKERATKRFQVLAQVHFILSDPEKRSLYDEHGIIANDEGLDSEADWASYWRLLFPKISEADIDKFLNTYTGSEEEETDLITIYNRFKGDLNKISETHISYDEDRTTEQLRHLIDEGKIENFAKFSKESSKKKSKRSRRAEKEAREAEQLKQEIMKKSGASVDNFGDLTAMIQKRSKGNFDSMIASLEAKYANNGKTKGTKRKRDNK